MALPSNNKVASSLSPMASDAGAQSHSQSHSHSHPGSGAVAMAPESSNTKSAANSSTEYQLRKYLLLLATLVATVTYVVGLNLPGGAWQEDTWVGRHHHHAGDPILQVAHLHRYLTFYYCNAMAFAASLVVSLLLLVLDGRNTGWWEPLLRFVMVLDLLGLMGAYAAGSCRDKFTTIYSALLVCAVFAYVVVAFVFYLFSSDGKQRVVEALPFLKKSKDEPQAPADAEKRGGGESGTDGTYERRQELHEVLMLLATFAVTITYVAGLNPPGGFWSETKDGHKMSDPVLQEHYSSRYQAFYVCNTTAFVASLLIIILLLDKKLTTKLVNILLVVVDKKHTITKCTLSVRFVALYGLTITALLGLIGAYAAGSCRQLDDTTYVICLIAGVLAYIFLQVVIAGWSWIQNVYHSALDFLVELRRRCGLLDRLPQVQQLQQDQNNLNLFSSRPQEDQNKQDQNQISSRSCRGLQVPGDIQPDQGNSQETVERQKVLDLLEKKRLEEKKALDLEKERLEKARSSLVMLLATLVVSITYSAGMDPPGGLWPDTRDNHRIGDPILLTTHPTRYKVFFYSNSAAFVASLIVILMVQSRSLLKGGILEAAMILDLFGLISAYAAGSCRDETTSIYVVALAGLVLVYVVIHIVLFTLDHEQDNLRRQDDDAESQRLLLLQKLENRREVLLLLAILAATLTYQAGLTPPGGFWSEDKDGHRAGYPVLHDNYRPRYSAFFYCNAVSFMASVALIVLLVNRNLYRPGIKCYALYVCMVVGMFGLMGAYAAGSSRDLRTSIYVLTLVVAVFAFIALEVVIFWVWPCLKKHCNKQWWRCCCKNTQDQEEHNKNTQDHQEHSKNTQDHQEHSKNTQDHQEHSKNTQDHQERSKNTQDHREHGKNTQDQLSDSGSSEEKEEEKEERNMREYLMLLGVLAASVTYQTGLKPPGGLWQDNSDSHSAGSSILHYINKRRYHAFFYCNSTSFMASVVVIILLLHRIHRLSRSDKKKHPESEQEQKQEHQLNNLPLWPMHTAILLDMLGLLGAYAAGSTRDWKTSRNVIYLVIPVLAYIAIYAAIKAGSIYRARKGKDGASATANTSKSGEHKSPGTNEDQK